MKKRYLSAVMSICLGGLALALLGVLLTSRIGTSLASPRIDTADRPDLIIEVYAVNETVLASEVITYRLVFTNEHSAPLSGVVITSTLSAWQVYTTSYGYLIDPVIGAGTSFTLFDGHHDTGYALEWRLGDLDTGAQGWIVVTTTLREAAEPPWDDKDRWLLLGMAAVIATSTDGVSVGNPQGEEADDASVMVVGPVLQVTKVGYPDPVRPGRLLTYTLVVWNKDREDAITANGVVITDVVPEHTSLVTASHLHVISPTAEEDWVVWYPPEPLDPGQTVAVTVTVRVTESFEGCPPPKIANKTYKASSNERLNAVDGDLFKVPVGDVVVKTIETPRPPLGLNEVFPGGFVTYTISVFNPLHDRSLTGLRVTETLPGVPNPFEFQHMVGGNPTVPTPVTTTPQVVWDGLSVEPGGVISFSFQAWVPYHIELGSGGEVYENSLAASANEVTICDMEDHEPSDAKVMPQIKPVKTVEPGHVLSGELVTYTITLENVGDTEVKDIRLTDTLPSEFPADFYYVDMLVGPEPVSVAGNRVVWDGAVDDPPWHHAWAVPPYSQISWSFRAVAIGRALEKYQNKLSASSPWTSIPDWTGAKVKIDPPFTINKIVEPGEALIGETVAYEIRICNVATGTYEIDWVADELPVGFVHDRPPIPSPNHFEDYLSPPETLESGDCMWYPFSADVTWGVGCGSLPDTFWNVAGAVGFHVVGDGPRWWVNKDSLAPLVVKPHVSVEHIANHKAVLPGETVVYTISLINNIPVQIQNVTVRDILPIDVYTNYFVYLDTITGPDPFDVTENVVEWQNVTVPPLGKRDLVFRVQVPEFIAFQNYKSDVDAVQEDLYFCVEDLDPTAPVAVVEEIIEIKKKAKPDAVPPLGLLQYEISLKNKDSVPVGGVALTETLPSEFAQDFVFVEMVPGDPEPSEVAGQRVVWRDLTVPGGGTLKLRFYVQAPALYTVYPNWLEAWCPRSEEITFNPVDVWAPVTVLPGVLVENTVSPTQTVNGEVVAYTITVHNQTDDALANVRITNTLPPGFSFMIGFANPPPTGGYDPPVWVFNSVKARTVQEIVFLARVGCDVTSGVYMNNVEGYSADALIPGLEEAAPVVVEATGKPCTSLEASVSPTRVVNGGIVTYTVTVENNAEQLDDVRITDTLPTKFTFVEMVGDEPVYQPVTTTPQVAWTVGNLPWPGSLRTLMFRARAGFGLSSGTYRSTVEGYSSSRSVPRLIDAAPVVVDAVVEPGVFLEKRVWPTETVNGGIVVYTISLENRTDTVLENAQIEDTLPVSFTYLSMLEGPAPAKKSPVEWRLGDVGIGEQVDLAFQVYVGCDVMTGTYSNTVEASSFTAIIPDLPETAPVTVASSGQPCIFFHKTVTPTQVEPGNAVVYAITLTNQSGADLTDVRITDTLPISFSYLEMVDFGPEPILVSPLVWGFPIAIQDGETYRLAFRVEVGSDVPEDRYYNGIVGQSSSAVIPGMERAAPVEVRVGGTGGGGNVFLPLILRKYG